MTSNEIPKDGDKASPVKRNSPPKTPKRVRAPAATAPATPSTPTAPAADTPVLESQPATADQAKIEPLSPDAASAIAPAPASAPPRGKKRKASAREPDNPKKHKPYTPHGTIFKWEDNPHIARNSPYKLGEPRRRDLKLKLVATTGVTYPYAFIHRHTMDWNRKADLAQAHKWRKQVLDRTLNKWRGEGVDTTKKTRPHWTDREKGFVEHLIKKEIRENRARLTHHDWKTISDKHNQYWVGRTVKVGEKTPAGKNNKGGMTKPGRVKSAHTLPARTINAIYSQAQRWPETKELIENEYARLQIPVDDEADAAEAKTIAGGSQEGPTADGYESTDSSDDEEDDLNVSGSPIDGNLEDSSDEEDDDQRPASNQTGARPIPFW